MVSPCRSTHTPLVHSTNEGASADLLELPPPSLGEAAPALGYGVCSEIQAHVCGGGWVRLGVPHFQNCSSVNWVHLSGHLCTRSGPSARAHRHGQKARRFGEGEHSPSPTCTRAQTKACTKACGRGTSVPPVHTGGGDGPTTVVHLEARREAAHACGSTPRRWGGRATLKLVARQQMHAKAHRDDGAALAIRIPCAQFPPRGDTPGLPRSTHHVPSRSR